MKAAYLAALNNFYTLAEHPNPDEKSLEQFFRERSLGRARAVLKQLQQQGARIWYANRPSTQVISSVVTGNTGHIRVCTVDTSLQVRESDGSVLDDSVVSELNEAVLMKRANRWFIVRQTTVKDWPDTEGCRL